MTLVLPSDREIVLTRVFAAPRGLVFEAWTRPEHVRQWYGCGEFTLAVCEIDLRVGGAYRYTMLSPDGAEHTMRGVYREIVPPGRLVYTEQYVSRGSTSNAALVTVLFAEHGGLTTLTSTILHQSKEDRDGHLDSGMETGAGAVLDRLAQHLATM
jgi:uncharacterized protein YndB with AHSA1/START domain